MSRTSFSYTFPAIDGVSVSVKSTLGSIEIESWDKPEVSVTGTHEEDTRVEAGEENGRVWVRTRTDDWIFGIHRHVHADISIRLPRKCSLTCSTVSGSIRVQSVEGEAHLSAVDGTIRVSDFDGLLDTDTVNGRVLGSRVRGEVRVHTTNGNVALDSSEIKRLKADMVNGDVRVETPIIADGEYDGNAMNGRMTLIVPEDAKCNVILNTLSGRIRTTLPAEIRRRIGSAEATINGGGPLVRFSTVNGDIVIRSSEDSDSKRATIEVKPDIHFRVEVPRPPRPPRPVRPAHIRHVHPTRMQVLRAVEKGEITVDQALEELKELT
jgi:DUF4097 and DUF4098 domain-containing protein YvlB